MEMLFAVIALLSAFGAGYFFGNVVPDWRNDVEFEDLVEGRQEREIQRDGFWPYGESGCFSGAALLEREFWANGYGCRLINAALLGLSVLFAYCAWGWPQANDNKSTLLAWLFSKPYWMLVACLVAGYIYSRITDRGPLGPLA